MSRFDIGTSDAPGGHFWHYSYILAILNRIFAL